MATYCHGVCVCMPLSLRCLFRLPLSSLRSISTLPCSPVSSISALLLYTTSNYLRNPLKRYATLCFHWGLRG